MEIMIGRIIFKISFALSNNVVASVTSASAKAGNTYKETIEIIFFIINLMTFYLTTKLYNTSIIKGNANCGLLNIAPSKIPAEIKKEITGVIKTKSIIYQGDKPPD